MKTAVIYHGGGCYDGFTAAWIAHKVWPDAEFYPMLHNDPLPDLTGMDVVLLDITFSLPVMQKLCGMAASVKVLDHHFTSKAVLEALGDKVWVCFDISRSGAGLAWDVLMAGVARPSLINVVEDVDLGKFPHYGEEDTKCYHCALTAFPQTFEAWDIIEGRTFSKLWSMGGSIRDARLNLAREVCARANPIRVYMADGDPLRVWCVNAPLELTFEVNEVLSTREWKGERLPVLTWFWDGVRGVNQHSLRSWEGGPDVERAAAGFGGGGHKTAAGFTVEFDPENMLAENGW